MSSVPMKENRFPQQQLLEMTGELIACGRRLDHLGQVPATSSNFSMRVDEHHCLVTASGKHKGFLDPEDFVVINFANEPVQYLVDLLGLPAVKSEVSLPKSSAEARLHTQIYQALPDIQVVLHTHSPAATLMSMLGDDFIHLKGYELLKAFPGIDTHDTEVMIPIVENSQNMETLRQAVAESDAIGTASAYVIRGHGVYVWGRTVAGCLNVLEALECMLEIEFQKRKVVKS